MALADSQYSSHRNPLSFTPINHPTSLPTVAPPDHIGRTLEGNSLNGLHDSSMSQTSTKTAKKRKHLPPNRVISLGRDCEYDDEGDVYYNGATSEGSLGKEKRTITSKRFQPMRIPSKTSIKWDDRGRGSIHNGEGHIEEYSELTTPPDVSQRRQSKVVSASLKSKGKQTPAFKNPTITKPSINRGKEIATHRPNSIISHTSWRSTGESVKLTSIVLAKTTMEKLASFRFDPPPKPQDTTVSLSQIHNLSSYKAFHNLPCTPLQGTAHTSSDYDLPIEEFLIDDTMLAFTAHKNFSDQNEGQAQPGAELSLVNFNERSLQDGAAENGPCRIEFAGDIDSKASPYAGHNSPDHQQRCSEDAMELSDINVNPFDTTSSEGRPSENVTALESSVESLIQTVEGFVVDPITGEGTETMGDVARMIDDEAQNAVPFPVLKSEQETANDSLITADCSLDHTQFCENPHEEAHHTHLDQGAAKIFRDNHGDKLQSQKRPFATHHTLWRHDMDVQVEQSDFEIPKIVSKELSRKLWTSDEFDQGLDDDDLLAIAPDTAIPQSQETSQYALQETPKVCGRFLLPPTQAPPEPRNQRLQALPKLTTQNEIDSTCSLLRDFPALDDEFPMDEEDEKEMLKLTRLGGATKESFAPPESIEQAFNDLADGEVYHSHLQFSPPKSQAPGASPSKVTRDQHTDKTRTSQPSGFGKDSLPSGEEEEWSFNQSNERRETENTSDRFRNPSTATTTRAKSLQVLPSPAGRSGADHPNTRTPSQKTTDASWSIIDDCHEYEPMQPFARPDFPGLVLDRSPVVGLSSQTYLRTCFRIGEMYKEGIRRASLGQDAVIELFCRVTFSSRELGSTKQHFQFSDLWHDRPPYSNGLLANYKTTELANSESKAFLDDSGTMARCLGRFNRDLKNSTWLLHIINIRETDWEEIRWTREVVSMAR